jgi:hypothetical protein
MSSDANKIVQWDGKVLTGWILIDGEQKKVAADRNTIHQHASGFNDALTWEIDRHRAEIFEKLKPHFKSLHDTQAAHQPAYHAVTPDPSSAGTSL